MKSNNYVVIMAGGKGTRLWPMSRTKFPKQIQKLIGNKSLIQMTFNRLKKIFPTKNIFISTNDQYKTLIAKQIPEIPKNNYIIEPIARNTAPAIGLVCAKILKQDKNAIITTIASDHVVKNVDTFNKSIIICQNYISKNPKMIGTIGIKPTFGHTGYGYIKKNKMLNKSGNFKIYKVDKFVEKPNKRTALKYFKSGQFFWNASYFSFKAQTILNYLDKYEPVIAKYINNIFKDINTKKETKTIKNQFAKIPELAFDYLIEKISSVFVIPADLGWDDIGSWDAIKKNITSNDKNVSRGNTLSVDNKDCLVYAQDKLIATIGLKNIAIIDTDDAILICDKSRSQDVKKIIEKLQSNKKYNKYL